MKAIDEKDVEPTGDLLRTRRLYFEEGAGVSKALCDGYISKMRLMDYENKDWRTTVMQGWVYFSSSAPPTPSSWGCKCISNASTIGIKYGLYTEKCAYVFTVDHMYK